MHRLFFILPLRKVARVGVALLTLGAPLAQESPAQRPVRQPIPSSGTLRTTPVEDLDKMKQVYNDFKKLESVWPIPAFPKIINMGTFDPATGTFDSVLTTEHEGVSAGGRPHTQIPTVTVNAALVKLHFDLGNNQTGVVVTVNGKSATVPPRQNSVTISAGFAPQVRWSLRSGIKSHDDTLIIKRPYVLGAGAFTLPVLPIAVVYAPPQERRVDATATYSKTEWIGSTVSVSSSFEDSSTSGEFDALAPFGEKLKGVKDAISAIPAASAAGAFAAVGPYFGAAIAGAQLLAAAFPDNKTSLISGKSVTQDHKLNTLDVVKDAVTTAAQKGPGVGDVILYLKNVRLVWLCDKGDVRLAVLGAEDLRWYSAEILKEDLQGIKLPIGNVSRPGAPGITVVRGPRSGAVTHLDGDTIQSLLNLDPFAVGGPDAELSQIRFERDRGSGGAGEGSFSHTISHQIEQTDVNTNVQFFTHLTDTKPGWFSLFGVGDQSEEIIKTTVTYGSSVADRSGQTIEETLNAVPPPDDPNAPYYADIYYDRIFGALAFKETPPGQRRKQH